MFVGTGTPRKPAERLEARRLRREDGMPLRQIARRLGVSLSIVHAWTKDIELTPAQVRVNLQGPGGPRNPEAIAARAKTWAARNRARRRDYQLDGRAKARERDPIHIAGCMLYWAEGAKSRNSAALGNSDVHIVRFFREFITSCFGLGPQAFTVRLNVYTTNGLRIEEIEARWLRALTLPRSCLRGHTLNHRPTSSSGQKKNTLPYGVCTLRVLRSTWIVQHIYGAIQEYGGFDEPRWLD